MTTNKLNFNSLVGRSGLYTFFSFGLAMCILILFFVWISTNQMLSLVETENENHVQTIVSMFDHEIYHYLKLVRQESSSTTFVNAVMNPESAEYYLPDYMDSILFSEVQGMYSLITFDGMIVHSTDTNLKFGDDYSNYNTFFKDNTLKSEIQFKDTDLTISFIGEVNYNKYTEGYLIYTTQITDLFKSTDFLYTKTKQDRYFALLFNEDVLIEMGKEEENYIISVFPLESIPLQIGVGTTTESISHPLRIIIFQLIVSSIVILVLLSIIFSIIISHKLTKPLLDFHSGIQKITDGQWETLNVYEKDPSEIQFLRKSFNEMQNSIKEKTTELELSNTELQKSNDSLLKTQKQLVQSEKMASIGQLAAGVAHEINNPTGFVTNNLEIMTEYLNVYRRIYDQVDLLMKDYNKNSNTSEIDSILSNIESIREEEDFTHIFEDSFHLLRESLDGTHRIKNIVLGLKNFARSGNRSFTKSNINLSINDALKLTMNELKYKCDIKKELSDLPEISCRRDQLTQVFINLLINASHAIKDHGTITIRSRLEQELVIVSISDTGTGIPEQNMSRLFDPFFTTKDTGKGTGLGLAISFNIIEEHQGEIQVESQKGKGSTFTIRIPVNI